MKPRAIVLALMAASLTLVVPGCVATMSDVIAERRNGGGTSVVYDVTVSDAFEIARTIFEWEVGEPIELHREDGYMLTSTDPDLIGWGSVMGAWVEGFGDGRTKVTVVTKRRSTMGLVTALTERTFHRRFVQAMAILESGESLPDVPPRYTQTPRSSH